MSAEKVKHSKTFNNKKENYFPLVRINEGEKWYEHEYNEKLEPKAKQDATKLSEAEAMATKLLERDCERAEILRKQKGQSDAGWISKVIKSGTQADRISAVQLMTQMEPVHSLTHVNSLIELLKKHRTREGIPILSALKDIFIDELLPENRKLVPFKLRPITNLEKLSSGNVQTVEKRLILWKFESDLKKCYEQFVQNLEVIASSQIETVAIHACRIISELLTKKPEQEATLLATLANKLGHPNKVVASNVSDFLYTVCNEHPAMRFTVVSEVERVTFRKNIPLKAQMYAAHFMSRIVFSEGDSEIAVKLLQIYFTLFKLLIKAELDNHRIVAIIMIGANRALPYAKDKVDQLMPEIDSLYKIVHVEKFSIALAALKVLFQMQSLSKSFSDRFYNAFYRRLLTIHSSTHDTELFHLLERVILSDESAERVKAFLKRMLQLALCNNPAFATAALLLCFNVSQQKQGIIKLTKKATDSLLSATIKSSVESDDEEEHYVDVVEPSKIEVKKPPTPKVIYVKGKAVTKLSEHNSKEKKPAKPAVNGVNGQVGWIHRKDPNQKSEAIKHLGYNHEARNPLFANADTVVDTELFLLSQHYHPTVAVFAQNMIDGKPIKYNGEPLEDFTLIRFLDRFSFKNPKVSTFEKAPLFQHKYNPRGIRKIGPSSQDYVTKHIDEIPIDERYLHHFASIKLQNAAKKKKESGEKDFDDVASVDSDEFETIMDRFEPGEANDDFEVDFGEMFGPEKSRDKKGKKQKRKAGGDEEDDDEDLDVDEAEFMYSDDEGLDDDDDEEAGDDDEEEEVDDDDDELDDGDDDEIGEEDEESDGALPPKRQNKFDLDDMDSDEEADDYSTHLSYAKDALQSAEKIDDFMDFEDEDASLQKKKKKQKVKKPKGFKKRRKN